MRTRARHLIVALLAIAVISGAGKVAQSHWLLEPKPMCMYQSLRLKYGAAVPDLTNYTRDYPMGKGDPPIITNIWTVREAPFINELAEIRVDAETKGGAGDEMTPSMQRVAHMELSFTLNGGANWYTNNWDGTRHGTGIPVDSFTREVLIVKNSGTNFYKQYYTSTRPVLVSPFSSVYSEADVPPAPNRRCYTGSVDPICVAYVAKVGIPYNMPCPWGTACPLNDIYPPDTGVEPGGWPAPSCSKNGVGEHDKCNVQGFPEGGGDILDYYPSIDPFPGAENEFPFIPGEPLIRVNGVPAISCDIYYARPDAAELEATYGLRMPEHPLCQTPVQPAVKAMYDKFGIKSYTINTKQGLVRFKTELAPTDVVDATFYTASKIWTTKVNLQDPLFTAFNRVGGKLPYHVKVWDTCGNLSTGVHSPQYPTFPGEANEAYVGVSDFYYDLIPTDTDPMVQSFVDDIKTTCSATSTCCPNGKDKLPHEQQVVNAEADGNNFDPVCLTDKNCECTYNECAGDNNTHCDYDGPVKPDIEAQCGPIASDGNAPGCGSEFNDPSLFGSGDLHKGFLEIEEFKFSHTASNLYIKTQTTGDITYGCYGSWYPLIGCEYSGGTLASKFAGYAWSLMNGDNQGAYYLIIIPEIPVYGPISLFINIPDLLASLTSNSVYDGDKLERYAAGLDFCVPEPTDEERCELLGCSSADLADDEADCDGDLVLNGYDTCPCKPATKGEVDGCPTEIDVLSLISCKACQAEIVSGKKMYVELGKADTIGEVNTYYNGFAMPMAIHSLDFEMGPNGLFCAATKGGGLTLTGLAQDQSPRINYYVGSSASRSYINVTTDYTAPVPPTDLEVCLGRCDEADRTDTIDNDGDIAALEPNSDMRVEEGYLPTSTQGEIKWRESVFNNDGLRSNLMDLGGYQIEISRGRIGPYQTYHVMCDPVLDTSGDCWGMLPTPRPAPELDEPYDGILSPEIRTRFPAPYDETQPLTGYGFPGETIACVIDTDCDPPGDGVDDDKDGIVDEGCLALNCSDDSTQLAADGQEYWLRVRAFDMPKDGPATGTTVMNFSEYTPPLSIKILRNTVPPSPTDVVESYVMNDGGSAKIVWNPNTETDMGGYAVYRCPANPVDAVIKTIDGTLDAYCSDPANYRQAHKNILDKLTGYYVDQGFGFRETGIGTGGSTPTQYIPTCSLQNTAGEFIKDDNCNWTLADDVGIDGAAGTGDVGEGDELPTPGEPHAYEWVDCSWISSASGPNPDLQWCGNISASDTAWLSDPAAVMYSTDTMPMKTLDVSALPGYNPAIHPPVLFYNGLIDGYKYHYFVRSIDRPYAGDGADNPGTCNNGVNTFDPATKEGCVNPIAGRNCDDKRITYDWPAGGNCSVIDPATFSSIVYTMVPADTQPPQKPQGLVLQSNREGTAVTMSWNMASTDRTVDHFNIYRSLDKNNLYACVRGGCDTPPYTDGCQCTADTDCHTGHACEIPYKICTNSPYYSVAPTTIGCSGDSNRAPGCQCTASTQCAAGYSCDNNITICKPGAGYTPTPNDGIDNDGDGLIDEDVIHTLTAGNGIDEDGDGLIDEDTGLVNTGEASWLVGGCPTFSYPFNSPDNTSNQERIYNKSFTDHSVVRDKTYFYRIAGVDKAVYDPYDGTPTDKDPPPPNEGPWSDSSIITSPDSQAPSMVIGACTHPISHNAMPCSGITDETFCPQQGGSDLYGNQLSVWWLRNNDSDVLGYNVYRAEDANSLGYEPAASAFKKVSTALIAQTAATAATQTICFKDKNIDNGVDFYYAVTAIDKNGNETSFSEINGPVQAHDTIAPMTPPWGTQGGISSDINGTKLTVKWEEHDDYGYYSDAQGVKQAFPTEIDFDHFEVYRSSNDDICEESEICGKAANSSTSTFKNGYCSTNKDCATGSSCTSSGICCKTGACCTDTVTDSILVDNAVTLDNQYYYCVRSVDINGNRSTYSTATGATPKDSVPPLPPTGLNATSLSDGRIGLGWRKSEQSDTAGYQIYWSTSPTGTYSAIDLLTTDTGYTTVTNLVGQAVKIVASLSFIDNRDRIIGMTYYYKIAAVDTNGNISQLSDYVSIAPTVMDTTAPVAPSNVYARAGYDKGESGSEKTDGIDNDGDKYVDDTNLPNGIEIYWGRSTEPDVTNYAIYRSGPSPISGCTCNVTDSPQGDCDSDGVPNAKDDCPCTIVSPLTNQFGTYSLIKSLDPGAAKCGTSVTYPADSTQAETCTYKDPKPTETEGLCSNTMYWYTIVPIDSVGNVAAIDKSVASPAIPTPQADSASPDKPDKPVVVATQSGDSLVVKFKENPTTAANSDLSGYTIYRDTKSTGAFSTVAAILNDTSKIAHCDKANTAPCYCDQADPSYACYNDISVEQGKRYYYKITAFDVDGNESDKSDFSYGTASPTNPNPVSNLTTRPASDNPNQLRITWSAGNMLSNPDIAGFSLYRATTSGTSATWQIIDPDPSTPAVEKFRQEYYVDNALNSFTTYWYKVVTNRVDGKNSDDTEACGVPGEDIFAPNRPAGLRTLALNTGAKLSWTENNETDLAGYNVFRASQKNGTYTKVNTDLITKPSYIDTGLLNNTLYYYCVTAVDNSESHDTAGCYTDIAADESPCSVPVGVSPSSSGTSTSSRPLSLDRGWNLISIPAVKASGGTVSITRPDSTRSLDLYGHISTSGYSRITPDTPTPSEDLAGKGIWVYADNDGENIEVTGSLNLDQTSDIQVSAGWNLIGNPMLNDLEWDDVNVTVSLDNGLSFVPLSQAISSSIITNTLLFDPVAAAYRTLNTGQNLTWGKGFWVKMSQTAIIRFSK